MKIVYISGMGIVSKYIHGTTTRGIACLMSGLYCIIVAIPEAVTVDDGAIANYEALRPSASVLYVCLCLDTDRRILNAEPLRLSPLSLFMSFRGSVAFRSLLSLRHSLH